MTVKELKTNNMATPNKLKGSLSEFAPKSPEGDKKKEGGGGSGIDAEKGMEIASSFMYKGGVSSAPSSFKMRSGNSSALPFKEMGSSPAKGFSIGGALGNLFGKKGGGNSLLDKAKAMAQKKLDMGGGGADLEGRVAALEAGSTGGDGGAIDGGMFGGNKETLMNQKDPTKRFNMATGQFDDIGEQSARGFEKIDRQGGGWGGIGSAGALSVSDIRLKEKIERAGKSPSGIPIYVFSYIGDNNRYEGAMAQDLISMGIDAVEMQDSGYYMVDYSKIDVDMKLIN